MFPVVVRRRSGDLCPLHLVGTPLLNTLRRLLALSAALLIGSLLLSIAPASAHTGFESSEPADGSTTDTVVSEIVLNYSGAAEPAGEGFVVLDPSGALRSPDSATPNADSTAWTLGFDPPLSNGVVGVRWTVQAPDAHPIEGSFSFTVNAPATEAAEPTSQQPVDNADSSAPEQQSAADTDPTETTVQQEDAAAADQPAPATQDLDAFLTQAPVAAPNAEGVGAFGRLLGFVGTMLGIGGLVFAAYVIRDQRPDILSVLKAVRYSAVTVVIGTAIDLVAHLAVANNGWATFWSTTALESVGLSAYGLAVGLRMGAGVLLFLGARMTSQTFATNIASSPQRELVLAGGHSPGSIGAMTTWTDEGPSRDLPDVRYLEGSVLVEDETFGAPVSPAVIASILVLLASFTFDGHTVTEGNRWITGAVDMVHVVAGSIWAGGVVAFAVVLWRRHRRSHRLNALELAVRFSVIAGAALAAAGVAGTVLAAIILDSVSELWTTPWGQLLIAKFIAVAAAASLGTYNHFVVIPWLHDHPADDTRSIKLRNTATAEAALLVIVVTITAFLVGAAS